MNEALCIDFGTSSIRAVLRNVLGDLKVLPLGQVTERQDIDGASIPSAVSIESDGETIRFGQHARDAMLSGRPLAFSESSPKLWLKEPARLDENVLGGVELTRRDLLTGLIAYAMFAAGESGQWTVSQDPDEADIRIAHPVWPESIRHEADAALRQIAWLAANMAGEGDWGETTVEVLKSWTTSDDEDGVAPLLKVRVDTIEPVAAAVELLPAVNNQRRVCVVVDVGAGTTDIGIFHQLVPDAKTNRPHRLVPAGPTFSVFKAGDAIDVALLRLLSQRFPAAYRAKQIEIKTNIRALKEDLFKRGRLQLQGIDLALPDLESTDDIQRIAAEVRIGLQRCVEEARSALAAWLSASAGINQRLLVVMAGGGAELAFLRRAVTAPLSVHGGTYQFDVSTPEAPKGLSMHGAGYTRLAVGLGGVREGYDSVVHEHANLPSLSSLGAPKQAVRKW